MLANTPEMLCIFFLLFLSFFFFLWEGGLKYLEGDLNTYIHAHILTYTASCCMRKKRSIQLTLTFLPRGRPYGRHPFERRICAAFVWLWRRYSGKKHHNSHWAQKMWLRNLNVITQSLAFLLRNPFILEFPWYCKSDNQIWVVFGRLPPGMVSVRDEHIKRKPRQQRQPEQYAVLTWFDLWLIYRGVFSGTCRILFQICVF